MRKSRPLIFWPMIVLSVMMFAVALAYLPVVVAWSAATAKTEKFYVAVEFPWVMHQVKFLYVPLMKWHASFNGYSPALIVDEEEFTSIFFVQTSPIP